MDCVFIVGSLKQATVIWHVTHSDDPSEIGQQRSFEVIDGGEPPAGMDMYKDRQTIDNNCGHVLTTLPFQPIIRGNIVVKSS